MTRIQSIIEDSADFAWAYLFPFGLATILMSAVNNLAFIGLRAIYPPETWDYILICIHPMIAAIQEPFTSKLLGAATVLYLAESRETVTRIRMKPIHFGILGGMTVGLVEALSKMILPLSLDRAVLPPVLMHTLTGAILSSVVFRYASRDLSREGTLYIVGAYSVALLIHFIWNTRIAFWLGGANPC